MVPRGNLSDSQGVYVGMFEQSLLLDSGPAKKAGAVAASLAMQTAIAGTLLLLPLLYTQRIMFAPPNLPVILPLLPRAEPPAEPGHPAAAIHVRHDGRMFVPTTIPPLNPNLRVAFIDGPELGLPETAGQIGGIVVPPVDLPHAAPPPGPTVEPTPPAKPIRVTSDLQAAKLVHKVIPMYPRLAVLARVSGTVKLIGTVGADGRIQQLDVVSGPAMLVQAAIEAVRQWVYSPTTLNGKPVEVIAPIEVNFTLSQ